MKYSVILLFLFSFLMLSCGGDVAPNESNDQQEDTDQIDSTESDTIDITNTDSLVVNYIRLRQKYIRDNEGDEVDVHIEGTYFDHRNDFYIFNFTEDWGIESIQYAVVTNSNLKLNQVLEQKDSNFGELGSFLAQFFPESTSFYLGNFEAAPAYQIVDYTSVLLRTSFNRNTYYQATSQLYFLTSGLEPQPVFATTMGYDGECFNFKGYQEKFVIGKDPYSIVIEREEYGYTEDCDLMHEFKYKKVWTESHLLFTNEGGPSPNVPLYFVSDFINTPDFEAVPKNLTQLRIENGDTLYTDKLFSIVTTQFGSEKCAYVDESDYFEEQSSLIVSLELNAEGSFSLFKRDIGLNYDHYVTDRNAFLSAEENSTFTFVVIDLLDANKSVYKVWYPDNGEKFIYTTRPELFEQAEVEEEL